jgi:hypothetical protein
MSASRSKAAIVLVTRHVAEVPEADVSQAEAFPLEKGLAPALAAEEPIGYFGTRSCDPSKA